MGNKRTTTYLILLLAPLVTGVLLNFYLFCNQFRGGFPISWFFRYSTGEGSNTVILFTDWAALAIDLLAFFAAGFYCFLAYTLLRTGRKKLVAAETP